MSKNKIKEPVEEVKTSPKKKRKSWLGFLSGNFLKGDGVVRQLPFMFFISFIALIYIANGYYAESNVRKIDRLNKEVKELRSEYITLKSELNYRSKQSEVAKMIAEQGIYESITPPKKISLKQ